MIDKLFILFAFCLIIVLGDLQVHAGQSRCAQTLTVSDRLKHEVLKLESELKRELGETEEAAIRVAEINTQITDLEQTMSWTERTLWRWLAKILGGDVEKIDQLRSRKAKRDELKELLRKDKNEDAEADQAVLAKIDNWLREHDSNFAKLREVEAELNDIVCKGNACLRKIDDAISEVDHAKTMEAFDILSNNNSVSILSTMSTSGASGAANAAQRAAKGYIEAVKTLKTKLETRAAEIGNVDDTVDLVVDLVFDFGFDFLSVFNMFALGDLKDDLRQLRGQIAQIRDGFSSEYKKVKSELDETLCRVRRACNGNSSEQVP